MENSVLAEVILDHWPVWLTTLLLVVAAVIDGIQLKVPNWLTFPMIISGWIYSLLAYGGVGLGWSLLGAVVGLALLLPLYAIGGMGAGDVKLLAGVGAWMYAMIDATGSTTNAVWAMVFSFAVSTVVGAVLAVLMVLYRKAWAKHSSQFWMILNEIKTVKSPTQLSEIAAERKSSMLLLPYGIPIAIGSIAYFAWAGMLI